jgi:ammonia channel protein AmtB
LRQWFFFGYDLAFSPTADVTKWSWFGGTSGFGFVDVASKPTGDPNGLQLPELVYSFYQEMFACFTCVRFSYTLG